MMDIITVVGARPQFIKAAVVSRRWRQFSGVRERIVHTGQHFDDNMSTAFFKELDIPEADWNLGINRTSQAIMIGRMLEALERLFAEQRPDAVMVYGDTNSTLAGALAAATLHIPVAHVEAGMRSFSRRMPEELNRVMADHLASFLYCPTETAALNLQREGIDARIGQAEREPVGATFDRVAEVVFTGDVMYEGFLYYREALRRGVHRPMEWPAPPDPFILCTLHRHENTEDLPRLRSLVEALNQLAEIIPVVIPLHPHTREAMVRHELFFESGVWVKEPLPYLSMIWLLEKCRLVVTDSGGLQKEAYFAKKPCVTLRDQTEWLETLVTGWNTLCVRPDDLGRSVQALLNYGPKESDYNAALYGTPEASERICRHLFERLRRKAEA